MGGLALSANNIIETISDASSGTGNLTLSGALTVADQYVYGGTFADFFGLNHVFDYEIRDKSGNYEHGEGYLSSPTTLVRLTVFYNSLGTKAKINFPAGPGKIAYIATDAAAFGSRMLNQINHVLTPDSIGIRGQITMQADRLYIAPTLIPRPCNVSSVSYVVRVAAAAGKRMRIGIYNLVKQSDTGNNYDSSHMLYLDLGTVAVDTPGTKTLTTNFNLARGVYGFATISDGAPQIMSKGTNALELGLSANTYEGHPITHWYNDGAGQFAALPATTNGAMSAIMNAGAPQPMLRGGIR